MPRKRRRDSLFMTATGLLARVGEKVVYENVDTRIPRQSPFIGQFCQDDEGVRRCRAAGWPGLLALPRRQILLEARRVSSRYLEKASVGFRFPKNHP